MSWPYVKPGGFYTIEDIDEQKGGFNFETNPERLTAGTREILESNHVFFADTAVGRKAWRNWQDTVDPQ